MDIKRQYDHGKLGNFLFNICAGGTKFLVKHRWLYYLLACTGGILQTVIGLLITIILFYVKLFFKDSIHFKKYGGIYGVKAGPEYGGGFEMGLMYVRDQKSSESYIDSHEFGHTISQLGLGPLYLLTIAIHSATRYGVQEFRERKGKKNPPYDQYGAEDAASQCGLYAIQYINEQKKKKEEKKSAKNK